MSIQIQYRLQSTVDVYESAKGIALVSTVTGKAFSLGLNAAPMAKALQSGWLTEDEAAGKTNDLSQGYFALITMQKTGMLDARMVKGESVLFSVSPSPEESAFTGQIASGITYQLNRYAYLRQDNGCLLLESPLTPSRIAVHDGKLAGMLHHLCAGLRLDIAGEDAKVFLSALIALGIAEPAGVDNENSPMQFWQFHDLLYYARTLHGKTTYTIGATYRFHGKRPSLPAIRKPLSDDVIALPAPTALLSEQLGRPFSEVLGKRESRREFSDEPLTLEELGAFLYAAARIKRELAEPEQDDAVTMRPSPSGGARHALEIYPLVRHCTGLSPGGYHYDALNHRLERVPGNEEMIGTLLEENPFEFLGGNSPQVTFNIAARIGRTAWKYESIAFKLINQDMGCLYQTLYLVATALGLSPCALGSVNTDQLGKALGIDWREEPFIGAFTLGK
ncbi:MAG: SagB family peptide dehydrogenase [Humidesulfovibrio sp.]|uniref:SagB family peptide dehydrogenase n=1 Tax=Humidesulfovibrio sp. TaxID=2910988 RepID=UPI0027353B88|nr:SagB family peptide dehydrogenase [Humidesulfovibrio sp.]MDP2846656.1 SagB family peptide dehydrogenase [Humidesulfovibrio sp.]